MGKALELWFIRRWPSLLSASLFLLAYPPFNCWPVMLFALVPMLHQIRTSDSKEAWKNGYLFGLFVFLGQMYWLYDLANHWIHRPFLALVPWVITAVLEGLFFGWVARLIRHCYLRNWLLLIPVAWAGVEVCRSYFPVVALPWGLVATPLYRAPVLIQTAHFGTIYLVSAWVVLVNVFLTCLTDPSDPGVVGPSKGFRGASVAAIALALSLVSWFVYNMHSPSDPFTMTIGQPGVDMAFGNRHTRSDDLAGNIDQITDVAVKDGSQLLILPEGIYQDSDYPPKPRFRIDRRLPLLFGGERGNGPTYQTAFSFDGRWQYADKTRLVIFGEFVPGRSSFPWIATTFDLPSGDLSASTKGIQTVDVAGVRAGPMLCFEALFPEVSYVEARKGARFIAVMCIDDWYMGTPAPEQLKAASIFRAVETGLPLARSASTGYTLALDGHGNILAELPLKKPGGLRVTLNLPKESPLFPLLPVFPVAALLFSFALPWLPGRKHHA